MPLCLAYYFTVSTLSTKIILGVIPSQTDILDQKKHKLQKKRMSGVTPKFLNFGNFLDLNKVTSTEGGCLVISFLCNK